MRPMIERAKDYDDLSERAGRFLCDFIRATPHGVIALPTGRTPVGAYRLTVERLRARSVDCSGLFLVDIDEVVGLSPEHPESCAQTLRRQLLDRLPVSQASCRLLNGAAPDVLEELRCHVQAIRDRGGLDLAVLGIGLNGHVAFNEPGAPFEAPVHVTTLTEQTLDRLALTESSDGAHPRLGLTLGIATILQARRIVLLASGEEKAHVLNSALNGEITEQVPASALRMHSSLRVIADEAALASWIPKERGSCARRPENEWT